MHDDWDVALTRATQGLRQAHGSDPDSAAVLGSGQQTNEAAHVPGKLARGGFGTRNYDANTTPCVASAVTAYYRAFGSDAPPCTYETSTRLTATSQRALLYWGMGVSQHVQGTETARSSA